MIDVSLFSQYVDLAILGLLAGVLFGLFERFASGSSRALRIH